MIDRTQKLQTLIDDNPGIRFREIMRSSGLKNGVLSYYLKKLESTGVVKVVRGPRQVRFYSPDITEEESIVIKAKKRNSTCFVTCTNQRRWIRIFSISKRS